MWVKICGTTNLEDAQLAVDAGADALGFIFAPSKRRVTVEQAAVIAAALPSSVEKVGVFSPAEEHQIISTVRDAGLTAVQLHMGYERERTEWLSARLGPEIRLWQVVGFDVSAAQGTHADKTSMERVRDPMSDPRVSVVLLDAVSDGRSGGLGIPFPWKEAASTLAVPRAVWQQVAKRKGVELPKLVLAGGLTPENVGEAIDALSPWGVDVVSGVEASPGRKDPGRLLAFLAAAKGQPVA